MSDSSVRLIIGHTSTDEVKIWVRGDSQRTQAKLRLEHSNHPAQEKTLSLEASQFYTGILRFQGLEPDQLYSCYLTWASAPETAAGQFRTAPLEGNKVSFLLGSCNYPKVWGMADQAKAWRKIASIIGARKPSFMLHCGDQIYADAFPAFLRRLTLENYRRTYLKAWSGPAIPVLAWLPHYMILDDHEIRNDFSGKGKPSDAYGIQAYREFQHSHNPHTFGDGVFYYTFEWGAAHFFVLDTRTQRSGEEIINIEQMARLEEWLLQTPASTPKFVVTGVPFVGRLRFGGKDKWTGFPKQRESLLSFLASHSVANVFFLTGDMHHAYFSSMTISNPSGSTKIHELMSSPINQALDYGTGWFYRQGQERLADGTTCTTRIEDFHRIMDNVMLVTVDTEAGEVRGEIFHTKSRHVDPHPPHVMPLL